MSRDITRCHQRLQAIKQQADAIFTGRHPEIRVLVVAADRTRDEQDAYYAQGRTTPGHIITNAQWPDDPHCLTPAEAMDLLMERRDAQGIFELLPEPLQTQMLIEYNDIIQSLAPEGDIIYGGNFRSLKGGDHDHWELRDWRDDVPHVET